MSKFDLAAKHGDGSKKVAILIKGKLSDRQWQNFRECLLKCIRPYRTKIKVTIKEPRG
jgi:hypothetical protein